MQIINLIHWYIATCPKCGKPSLIKTHNLYRCVLACPHCGKRTSYWSSGTVNFEVREISKSEAKKFVMGDEE